MSAATSSPAQAQATQRPSGDTLAPHGTGQPAQSLASFPREVGRMRSRACIIADSDDAARSLTPRATGMGGDGRKTAATTIHARSERALLVRGADRKDTRLNSNH